MTMTIFFVWLVGVPFAYLAWLADASDGLSWHALRAQHADDVRAGRLRFGIYFALTGTFGVLLFGGFELGMRMIGRRE